MKKGLILVVISSLLFSTACEHEPQFQIQGNITKAEKKMLYFEAVALDGIKVLDSVRLDVKGHFNFKYRKPEAPDFYRLRLEANVINLGIDSTETVTIKAEYPTMATGYIVDGSTESEKIKELSLHQIELQRQIQNLSRCGLPIGIFRDSVNTLVKCYKERVKSNYIFQNPRSGYAYYALFQRINGLQLFNPESDREDVRTFAAVATSWDLLYPHSLRAINLHNITMRGMKNTRRQVEPQVNLNDLVNEVTLLDLALPDISGAIRKLTDLKGKVVLLDFTVYQNQVSAARNMLLRELYDQYASRGLEIYQVSYDTDEHFWKISADNLPWICVRDVVGTSASTYQVKDLPTYFLIDKENGLYKRNTDINDLQHLKTEIEGLL